MTDIYVLIVAAFHSADYFASRSCYILAQAAIIIDLRREKRRDAKLITQCNSDNENLIPHLTG